MKLVRFRLPAAARRAQAREDIGLSRWPGYSPVWASPAYRGGRAVGFYVRWFTRGLLVSLVPVVD